jgi:hypothetical protein
MTVDSCRESPGFATGKVLATGFLFIAQIWIERKIDETLQGR